MRNYFIRVNTESVVPNDVAAFVLLTIPVFSRIIFVLPVFLSIGKGRKTENDFEEGDVKVQEAAFKLLSTEGHPMSSRELAALALERGWVSSASSDPVFSIASTIEKNIRMGTYNRPQLVFIRTQAGRRIGLPNWRPEDLHYEPARRTVSVQIPEELAEKLKLATQARIAPTFDATVAMILRKGLAATAPHIRASMLRQLEALDQTSGPRP